MYILYIIVLKIKLITNLHALSVAIHVPPNTGINLSNSNCRGIDEEDLSLYTEQGHLQIAIPGVGGCQLLTPIHTLL